jgi:alpha-ketoglutarate-dependent taurine dioxygenase
MTSSNITLQSAPDALRIEGPDHPVREFSSTWLRDNARNNRDAVNGQRLIDITDVPAAPKIKSARLRAGIIEVQWEDQQVLSEFELAWLEEAIRPSRERRPELRIDRWPNGADLDAAVRFAWLDFAALASDSADKLSWLTRLTQSGLAFIRGVPTTEAGILESMRHVGRVCETNYGRVFDVRSVPQPENLAYSDLGLGLHTDNPYREPVPGFQALHALMISPDGGESLFADGFALAEHLRSARPEDFARLTSTPVPFRYRSKDADLYAERPLIQLRCDGQVSAVHYNNRSIAPFAKPDEPPDGFYAAYRRFAELLKEPSFQMRYRLKGGELVLFDNQRILHGRTAFTSARHPRHLRGCYLTRDSVYSETALLRNRLFGGGGT